MSREKQIESTDWLTRGISKEQLEREKREGIMSADLQECFTEFNSNGEIYVDFDVTAEKMVAKGYRKQSEGEWKNGVTGYICSVCGNQEATNRYSFCPNCGAKMKGGE